MIFDLRIYLRIRYWSLLTFTHTLFYLCHDIKMHYMQKQNNNNLRIFVEYVAHEENIQRNIRILNK